MATDSQIANENYERFCYARDNGHLDFVHKAEMCDEYFLGNQWDEAAVDRLNRLNKPAITVNKILSTCATVFGEQLNNRADVSFRPSKDATAEVASALDKVWMHLAQANNLDWLESEVATDGFIRGRGFFDVRINFDDSMQGEVRIKQLNSKNVVIDPDAECYDPDEWKEVFLTKWLTADDIGRIYGDAAQREIERKPNAGYNSRYDQVDWLPDSFGSSVNNWGKEHTEQDEQRRIYRVLERQYRVPKTVPHFVDMETGDSRPIPESWERERIHMAMQQFGLGVVKRRVEAIHWVTSIADLTLHNELSPYKHLTPVPYFPYFRHGRTIGIVENLISPQDLLNKSISQELHITNTTANSGWITKNGTLANMTVEELQDRGGEDGLVVVVNGDIGDIAKIQPNQVPQGIDRLSYKADEALKEVSMISDSMRGFDREDVAAKAIQAKQVRGSVSLAKPFDNLAYTRKLVARNVLDLVQSFYTETRVITITGRNLTDQAEQLTVNEVTPEGTIANDLTVGEFEAVITTVPARDTFEQSQFAEAIELRQLGIAIPDDVLVEHSHLNRKNEIAQRIKELMGGAEPSEAQQQMQQLEMQMKQLEAQEKQVDMQVKQANAQLNTARAQEVLFKMQNPEGGNEQAKAAAEQQLELGKLAMQREKMLLELEIEKEKLAQEMELMRQKIMMEAEAKREASDMSTMAAQQKIQSDTENQQWKAQQEQLKQEQKMRVEEQKMQLELQKAQLEHEAMLRKLEMEEEKTMRTMEREDATEQQRQMRESEAAEHKRKMAEKQQAAAEKQAKAKPAPRSK